LADFTALLTPRRCLREPLSNLTPFRDERSARGAVSSAPLERLSDAQYAGLEINVIPPKTQSFPKTKTQRGRHRNQRTQAMLFRGLQQRARLLRCERLNFFRAVAWNFNQRRDVVRHESPFPRLIQRGSEHSSRVSDVSSARALLLVLSEPLINVRRRQFREGTRAATSGRSAQFDPDLVRTPSLSRADRSLHQELLRTVRQVRLSLDRNEMNGGRHDPS
jgi:hypothetical protein